MPDDPIVQMASDPDFGKLPLTEQRKALAAHDASFGQLGDADVTKFVKAHQGAPSIPGAPNGLPPVPTAPLPEGIKGTPTRMGPRGIQIPQTDMSGQDFRGLGLTLSSVAALPAAAAVEAPAGLTGLSRFVPPAMRALATGAATVPGGAVSQIGAENPSAGNVLKEAGGYAAGSLTGEAAAPFLKWLTSSKTLGAKLLQSASTKAGNAPVQISPQTDAIVEEIVQQGKLGGTIPKVITDFLDRMGPSTRLPAEAPPNPLTYNEARILQSNASTMSAQEAMALKGRLKYLIPQFAKSLSGDVQTAADQAGIGMEHGLGMKEYAAASARNRVLGKAAGTAGKAALGAATGGAMYEIYRATRHQ